MKPGYFNFHLVISFSISIILIIAIGIISIFNMAHLVTQTKNLYEHPLVVSNAVLEANSHIISIHRSMKDVALAQDNEEIRIASAKVDEHERQVHRLFETIRQQYLGDPGQIDDAHQTFTDWKKIRDEVIALKLGGKSLEASDITKKRGADHVQIIQVKMNNLISFAKRKAEEFHKTAMESGSNVSLLMIILLAGAVIVSALSAIIALNTSASHVNKIQSISRESEKEQWIKVGYMKTMEQIQGEHKVEDISNIIISFLARYLESNIGAMYLTNDDVTLSLVGSYAFAAGDARFNSITFGEGIVGQVAVEKKPIQLSDVPEDYIKINSGIGETTPRHIIAVPLVFDQTLIGVLELGGLEPFREEQIALLEMVSENISIAITSMQAREKTNELLIKTQEQAEELQAQQEELRVANEELEEQTKVLRESEDQLKSQSEELRVTNEELEEQSRALEEQRDAITIKNDDLERARNEIEKKAYDLEQASKYKSEFLANMSHELRTPLNSVIMLSQILLDKKKGKLNEVQQELVRTIYSSGSDLHQLINEILDLSKVEAGKMVLNLEEVSLESVVSTLEKSFSHIAEEKGLAFDVTLSEELPATIFSDTQKLQQVLKNLISNAIKFTERGEVSISLNSFSGNTTNPLIADTNAKLVAISVKDTGIGIPEDKLSLIFEAFLQVDGTTSRRFGGTGLGLSISRELTRLLGGEIQVNSLPGIGSEFILILPERLESRDKPEEKSEAIIAEKQVQIEPIKTPDTLIQKEYVKDDRDEVSKEDKTILIIEDDNNFAKILLDLANQRGYKALVANDGETGLHFADYYNPSAIVLDIGLPNIDGTEVLNRLKENHRTRHIPVHVISAFDQKVNYRKMGALGYLKKPVTLEALEETFLGFENIFSKMIKNLLLVCSSEKEIKEIKQVFGNEDLNTVEAFSEDQARKLLDTQDFDCVVIDFDHSNQGDIDLIRSIKSDSNIPVIVYSHDEMSKELESKLNPLVESVIIEHDKNHLKLLDETTLFLHRIEKNLPQDKRDLLKLVHDKESMLGDKRILVVDDDMRNVFSITSLLETYCAEVLEATTGKEALDKLEKDKNIDLILMDIMMPEMDGYEASRMVRKMPHYRNVPIIALTAKAMKGDKAKCVEAGANDYIAKPVDNNKLLSLLRVWLSV